MSKYPQYEQLNLPKIAEEILEFWKRENIFEQSVSTREGNETFVFYEGPPSANGLPGIHHVMARSIKDIFCRYKTLKGYKVERKAGWDTHGLPIELGVEKELGITKDDIGKSISIEEYNQKCREAVMRYTNIWNELTEKMGYWVDMNDPYVTYENKYIESVWWLLNNLYEKNLLYKGYTIQPYSPAAGTGLSSHELNQPGCYKDVKDTTAVAIFTVVENDRLKVEQVFDSTLNIQHSKLAFLAWTTTPWTLPSNTALAVGPNIDYVLVSTFNAYTHEPITVVLAKNLLDKHFKKEASEIGLIDYKAGDKLIPYEILGECKGRDLAGICYEQLLPYAQPHEDADKAFRVITGDFVSTEDGTGIVHIAPTFGADDMRVAKENGVPALMVLDETGTPRPLVDLRGRFVKEVHDEVFPLAGKYVKEEYLNDSEKAADLAEQRSQLSHIIAEQKQYLSIDKLITLKLKLEGKAFHIDNNFVHSYPHCWRTDKPVLYYPLDSWFIKTTAVKDRMIALNKTINWKPESTGTGRFGNWLENLQDWNLSRSRYWGIPIPIWTSEDKSEQKSIGSVEQLKSEIEKSIAAGLMTSNPLANFEPGNNNADNYQQFDLHRPYADDIVLVSDSGKALYRESDLIDVWFDSGAMPYAQLHYPFENKALVDGRKNFPADFIAEGVDQTRGWFFTLHAIATLCFDSVAYKNVVSNGLVLDKNGQKMSKRLGNAIDPFTTLSTYGADATRWYMISNAQPWDNLKFDLEGIAEVQRKFFRALYNTYSFFALYANIDGFEIDEQNTVAVHEREELDRWIIARLQQLITEVDDAYENYDPTRASRALQDFVVDELSNWYIRLSRRRFWKGELSQDKKAAYETLFECLTVVSQLMAPVAPFFADWLFKNLKEGISQKAINSRFTHSSVHLSTLTSVNESLVDQSLLESMELAQKISSMLLSLRKKVDIRVRQPLGKALIPVLNDELKQKISRVAHLILSETNIKTIEFVGEDSGLFSKTIKANFKTLGPKYGKHMKAIAAALNGFDQDQIKQLELGAYELQIGEEKIILSPEDAEILTQDIPGWLVAAEKGITVALDISLNQELIHEGIARELVNRVQTLRKESGFEVSDKIVINISASEHVSAAIASNKPYICAEVLADKLTFDAKLNKENSVGIEIEEGETSFIQLIKLN